MTLLAWQIQSGGIRTFNCHRRVYRPGEQFAEHSHDYVEVFWLESGTLQHVCNGNAEWLTEGDVVALVPGERHAFIAADRRSATIVNVSMPQAAAQAVRDHYAIPAAAWPWAGTLAQRHRRLGTQARLALRHLVEVVDHHLASSRDVMVLTLVHGLSRSSRGALTALPAGLQYDIERFLEANPAISVSELAQQLHRSREGLSRLCRRSAGRALADMLREWRLDRAAEALVTSERGIADIAVSYGFQALGGFYKAFHKQFGVAPGAYRQQHA